MARDGALLVLLAIYAGLPLGFGQGYDPFIATFVDGPQRVVQLYNPSCSPLDVSRIQIEVLKGSNKRTSGTSLPMWGYSDHVLTLSEAHVPSGTLKGNGKIAPRDVFVLCGGDGNGGGRPTCESCDNHLRCDAFTLFLENSSGSSGDPSERLAIGLYLDGELVDTLGMEGDPQMMVPHSERTFVRKSGVSSGDVADWEPISGTSDVPHNDQWNILPYATMSYIDCHSIAEIESCSSTLPTCKQEGKSMVKSLTIRNVNGNFQAEELQGMQCSPDLFVSPFAGQLIGTAGTITHIARDTHGNTRVYLQDGMSPFGGLVVDGNTQGTRIPPIGSKGSVYGKVMKSPLEGVWLEAVMEIPEGAQGTSNLMKTLTIPTSLPLKTGTFSRASCSNKAEAYKAMLVKFEDLTVTQLPSGEIYVSDGSGYVQMKSSLGTSTEGERLVADSLGRGLNHVDEMTAVIDNINGTWVAFPRTAADVNGISRGTPAAQEQQEQIQPADTSQQNNEDTSTPSDSNTALGTAAAVLLGIVVGAAAVVILGLVSFYAWKWITRRKSRQVGELKRRQSTIPFVAELPPSDAIREGEGDNV